MGTVLEPTHPEPVPAPARLAARAASALGALAGLALPVECAGCAAPDVTLCPACRSLLVVPGRRVPGAVLPAGVGVWSGPDYDGAVARILLAWKEHGRGDLTRPLADTLAGVLRSALSVPGDAPPGSAGISRPAPVLLVPVPSRPSARRQRGEDLVRALALRAADRLRRTGGPPVRVAPMLTVGDRVRDQSGLTAAQRRDNLAGAMAVSTRRAALLPGRDCLVVDDVLTTAATVGEAVRVLGAAGGRVVEVATVCVTPRRS